MNMTRAADASIQAVSPVSMCGTSASFRATVGAAIPVVCTGTRFRPRFAAVSARLIPRGGARWSGPRSRGGPRLGAEQLHGIRPVLGPGAPADPEQPLAPQQPDEDGQIDDQGSHAENRDPLDKRIDLEGQES